MRLMKTASTGLAALLLATTVGACDGLLEVSDPQRFTSEDLDNALEAVAAGVEGDLYVTMDQFVIYQALLGDVFQHTGTWAGYDDIDHGRITYSNHNAEGNMREMLRARWFADDARERFTRVLGESEAGTSPLSAQVETVSAMADLLLGMMFCEAPAEPSGAAVSPETILQQAVTKFTSAMATSQSAGESDWVLVNTAGRARANLYLGNYDQALADASQIPDGWVKYAEFSQNSGRQDNDIVQLATAGNNRAAGLREKWWPMIDNDAELMRDPWTNELDPRIPASFDGTIAVDGVTDHYSQLKYQDLGSDVAFFDSEEMRLIEAEVYWQRGDLPMAIATMNALRSAAGLSPLPDTSDSDTVKQYLLSERFAETFMEGHRVVDLRRLGELRNVFAAMNDSERPATRPSYFPMDDNEARDNPNIDDNTSARCLPTT